MSKRIININDAEVEVHSAEVISFKDYRSLKSVAGESSGEELIDVQKDDEGGEWLSKNQVGRIEKAVGIKEPEAAAAAAERDVKFPAGSIERVKSIIGSDDRVDRHGDIVIQDWNLKEFGANPLVLFGHDWVSPPIGASLREKIGNIKDSEGIKRKALKMDLFFPSAEVTQFGDQMFRLVDSGLLRTFSVGFKPGQVTRITDKKEREKLGLGEFGFVLSENKLIEISLTPIPANPGAQLLACGFANGKIHGDEIQIVRELYRKHYEKKQDESAFSMTDAQLLSMWSRMFPHVKVSSKRSLGSTFNIDEIEVSTRIVVPAPKVKTAETSDESETDESESNVLDNGNNETKDEGIKKIIAEALEPLVAQLRTMKDSIDGLQSGFDDVIQINNDQKQLEDEALKPAKSKSIFGGTLATVLLKD